MGSSTKAGARPRVTVKVDGGGEVDRIEIVRDHKFVYAGTGDSLTYEDQSGNPEKRSVSYYYPRITFKDGNRIWASPVWIEW